MTESDKKIDEILKIGIATEINGHRFYTDFAKRVTHEETRTKIEVLANDELRHREILERMYRDYFHQEPTDIPEKGIGVFIKALKNRQLTTEISAPGLLDIAIEAESASCEFYTEGGKMATDDEIKSIFKRLADEEDGHFNLLTAEKNILAGIDWFAGSDGAPFEH